MDGSQAIGSIIPFGGNFAPRETALCHGSIFSIAQNQALYAIIGTIYGGDGRTNFQLPDLRGRVPAGTGQGPGLTNLSTGGLEGFQTMTLHTAHMPTHSHDATFSPVGGGPDEPTVTSTLKAVSNDADSNDPTGRVLAKAAENIYSSPTGFGKTPVDMAYNSIDNTVTGGDGIDGGFVTVLDTGGNQPFSIQSPILGINYCIATQGIFPSRN